MTNEDTATDESTSPNNNLLSNDTDADGDPLTIVAINNGNNSVGTQFVLTTGGLATVNSDGTFDLDPNGAYEDLAVGEIRTDSFTYKITDELLDPNNQGFDTATANITVAGVNDAPIISVDSGDSSAETVIETNAQLTTNGTLTISDVDTSDFVTSSVMSVSTSGKDDDASTPNNAALLAMLALSPINTLDNTEQTDTLNWSFGSNGEAFDYLADDENLELTYSVKALDDNGASDTQTVTITVDGTNDQPIAQDVSASIGEDDPSVTGSFDASDVDTTDILSYEIIAQPTDVNGNQYGSVVNNDDGTFTFNPLDNFQFLDANESRDVTFQYQAIDDSSVTATDTSAPKTITVTVNGAYDAPIDTPTDIMFQSFNQSTLGSGAGGEVINVQPFFGLEWDESFNQIIIGQQVFGQEIFSGIASLTDEIDDALSDVVQGLIDAAEIACDIATLGLGDCNFGPNDFDVGLSDIDDLPTSITTPSLGLAGGTSGKIGLQPLFSLDSGNVDSSIPVEVVFTTPNQVEVGDTFEIGTAFSVDGGATFSTESPQINFALDLIFDLAANFDLTVGASTFGGGSTTSVFDFDVDTTTRLFEFSSGDTGVTIPFGIGPIALSGSSLAVEIPDIQTTGVVDTPVPPADTTITSQGGDDFAELIIDYDQLLTQLGGLPPLGGIQLPSLPALKIDVLGEELNLLTVNNFDVQTVDIDFITTLSLLQDFSLDINELPLEITLEDGTVINQSSLSDPLNVGDTLTVTGDAVDTNGNGFIDFDVDVDIETIFDNLTTLGLTFEEFIGVLAADVDITSDFFPDVQFSLFGNNPLGLDNVVDGRSFLISEQVTLFNDDSVAEFFDGSFDLEGFNTVELTGQVDVA